MMLTRRHMAAVSTAVAAVGFAPSPALSQSPNLKLSDISAAAITCDERGFLFEGLAESQYDLLLGSCIDAYAKCCREVAGDLMFTVPQNSSVKATIMHALHDAAETLLYHSLEIHGSRISGYSPDSVRFFLAELGKKNFTERKIALKPSSALDADEIKSDLQTSYVAFSGIAPRRAIEALTANLR